jgi:hypothetical protein
MSAWENAAAPGEEQYPATELLIRLPADWPLDRDRSTSPANFWPAKWLEQISANPVGYHVWYEYPFAVVSNGAPPEPLAPTVRFTCLMLVREPEEVSPIRHGDGREIELFALIPLYTEERDFGRAQGLNALYARLRARGVPLFVDVNRKNSVTC